MDMNDQSKSMMVNNAQTEMMTSRQAQEVQAAIIMAKKMPRDEQIALAKIERACKRPSLAKRAHYSYPRGGTQIEGPSVHLLKAVAGAWGNLDFGIIELENKPGKGNLPGESTMMAFAWDLENNVRSSKIFTVRHKRDTKKGTNIVTDDRDIYEISANTGSRRLRAALIDVIPSDVVEEASDLCNQTLKAEAKGKSIGDRVGAMLGAFNEFGVTKAMIEKRLMHKIEATTEQELIGLQKVYTSIRDGYAGVADHFPPDQSEPNLPTDGPVEPPKTEAKSVRAPKPKNHAPTKAEIDAEARGEEPPPPVEENEVRNTNSTTLPADPNRNMDLLHKPKDQEFIDLMELCKANGISKASIETKYGRPFQSLTRADLVMIKMDILQQLETAKEE